MNYIDKLRKDISNLESTFNDLLDTVSIRYYDPNNDSRYSGIVSIGAICYHWQEGSDQTKTKSIQRQLKERYLDVKAAIDFLCGKETQQVLQDLKSSFSLLESYIELKASHSTPTNIPNGKKNVTELLKQLTDVLDHIQQANNENRTILIPDTNALAITADPIQYRSILSDNKFSFVITTPVLRELDSQKEDGRKSESYRGKVKKAIKRIKGFRTQGDITEGITVDKSISVKMDYKEPKVKDSFDWLDPDNNDDQVIGRSLELQKQYPNSDIVIVTSDINLQNKAIGARLNFSEPPSVNP